MLTVCSLSCAMAAPQDARTLRQMEVLLDVTEIAADTMQCICILDDVDDKLVDKPHLVEEAGISMGEVHEAMIILRRLADCAARARGRLQNQFEVVRMEGAPNPETRDYVSAEQVAAEPEQGDLQ